MINFWFVFMPVFAISMLGLSIAYFALSSNKEGESGGHKLSMKFILIAAISAVISAYISLNPWSVVKGDTAEGRAALLGQMGDFFGGMLNPILAFASFIALLYTIRIQSAQLALSRAELAETRLELARSAKAQEESGEALRSQYSAIEHQKFENRFFNFIQLFETEKEIVFKKSYHLLNIENHFQDGIDMKLGFGDFVWVLKQKRTGFHISTDEYGGCGPFRYGNDFISPWLHAQKLVMEQRKQFEQLFELLQLILIEVEQRGNPIRYYSVIQAIIPDELKFVICVWCSIGDVTELDVSEHVDFKNHKMRWRTLFKLIQKAGLLRPLLIDERGSVSAYNPLLNISGLPYDLTAYGDSHYIEMYTLSLKRENTGKAVDTPEN